MHVVETENLIEQIHAAQARLVLAASGGGSGALAELLTVPGASRTVIEATVPYAAEALADFLGAVPEQFCSERTARAMAMAAFVRAVQLSSDDPRDLAGVGCTASLASERPKRGPHRVHIAVQTADTTQSFSLELQKGKRSRGEEESLCSQLVLNAVAELCGLEDRVRLTLVEGEEVVSRHEKAPADWTALLLGNVSMVPAVSVVPARPAAGDVKVVFPGAFDPRHEGHRRMAEVARQTTGERVDHELSIENVDKPLLDFVEIADRLAAFAPEEPVWLTRTATFAEKSRIFPGATFIVGADTLIRIADPKYYGDDPEQAAQALAALADAGCRFLVFGRTIAGRFCSLADLQVPDRLRDICQAVPKETFRDDVSSTEIRRPIQTE